MSLLFNMPQACQLFQGASVFCRVEWDQLQETIHLGEVYILLVEQFQSIREIYAESEGKWSHRPHVKT